ncbi:hypothetical protein [Desulfoscipio geothermicus]|uniref:Uncharacterized protein n=1 Tax=Desulfoscipio geothermicus DSM 3669 TaxID=1121426 RepID=A0A1I6DP26_9FIRM|nr:hypothetical protein [Desulfoscipio geothermicus]SFR07112.1 hypothetical protein SAMN05660706_11442 [Desulfoscipio geothermicus DSM 3669]
MFTEKLVGKLTEDELRQAFKEIDDFRRTGILVQNGIVRKTHCEFEKQVNTELLSLRVTEDAILFEIAKRKYYHTQEAEEIVRRVNIHEELLEALKYARRFLNKENHDTDYIDEIIRKAKG